MSSFFGDDDDGPSLAQMQAEQDQDNMLKQKKAQQTYEDEELEKERIAALRGRFGGGDMADNISDLMNNSNQVNSTQKTASDLFQLITGQR